MVAYILRSLWQVPRESEDLGLASTLLGLSLVEVLGLMISWGPRSLDWGPVQSSKPICHLVMMAGSSFGRRLLEAGVSPGVARSSNQHFSPQRSSF